MTRQSDYLLQILENIGTPLMLAILQARAAAGFRPAGEEADLQQDAQRMAELLAKTVQTGMDIGDALELAAAGQSDSLRVALTALGSRFIGAHYGAAAKMPSDSDLKKIAAARSNYDVELDIKKLSRDLDRAKTRRCPALHQVIAKLNSIGTAGLGGDGRLNGIDTDLDRNAHSGFLATTTIDTPNGKLKFLSHKLSVEKILPRMPLRPEMAMLFSDSGLIPVSFMIVRPARIGGKKVMLA